MSRSYRSLKYLETPKKTQPYRRMRTQELLAE